MNILVTGGAGFIGSNIVDGLIEENHEVAVVDNLSTGKLEFVHPKAKFFKMDINDLELANVFSQFQPDIVIHHAAQIDVQTSISSPDFDGNVNILGTVSLLQKCRDYNVKKIIYASSAAIYGNPAYLPIDEKHSAMPISFYGVSKYTPEHYIRIFSEIYKLDFTILRYANVYGVRQDPRGEGGVISIFIDRMINDLRPIIFGNGNQTRDFIYVKDIVSANISALTRGSKSTFNISSNSPISINELVNKLNQVLNKNLIQEFREPREGDILHSYLNNELAQKNLDWKPKFLLNDGLLETCKYYIKRNQLTRYREVKV